MHDLKWQGIAATHADRKFEIAPPPDGPLTLRASEEPHQHWWVSAYNVPPVRIFQCACGERRQVTKLHDGSERDEVITKPGGSLCNLLPLKAGGSVIPVEEVLAAQK